MRSAKGTPACTLPVPNSFTGSTASAKPSASSSFLIPAPKIPSLLASSPLASMTSNIPSPSESKSNQFLSPSLSTSSAASLMLSATPFRLAGNPFASTALPVPGCPSPSGSVPPASVTSGIPSPSESKSRLFGIPSSSISSPLVNGFPSSTTSAISSVSKIPSLSSSISTSFSTPSPSSSGLDLQSLSPPASVSDKSSGDCSLVAPALFTPELPSASNTSASPSPSESTVLSTKPSSLTS